MLRTLIAASLLRSLHTKYSEVFNPMIPLDNGQSGNIKAKVNIGPTLPPQRKVHLPQYNKEILQLLQSKNDQLEAEGVFNKPEDLDIIVEYLNWTSLGYLLWRDSKVLQTSAFPHA